MNACPTLDHLKRLLSGDLDQAEESTLEEHLGRCSVCVETLDGLTTWEAREASPDGGRGWDRVTITLTNGDPESEGHGPRLVRRAIPTVPGYEILSELGRGGMGVVYKARHLRLGRIVALKLLPIGDGEDPRRRIRFRREAEAVARLQHPNIVQIFEVGEAEGHAYLALEYVDGGTLAGESSAGAMGFRRAAEIVEALARAVEAAHGQGVIHRDLKPSNVLLTGDGTPKVADFGLAKTFGPDSEAEQSIDSNAILGTPGYMAPEQAGAGPEHERPGPQADVYGLGAILYALISGRAPFEAGSPLDTLLLLRNEEPIPPRKLRPKVPRDLEIIALKCLSKSPSRRYAGAAKLAEDLARFLAGRPILARPAGPAEVAWRWCRREPKLAATSGLAALGIVLALAVTTWSNVALRSTNQALGTKQEELNRSLGEASRQKARALALNAEMNLDRGLALGAEGRPEEGLIRMARVLEAAPAPDDPIDRVARANLAAWSGVLPRYLGSFPRLSGVCVAAFSTDGRLAITSGDRSHPAWIYDTFTGERVNPAAGPNFWSFALHPGGEVVAAAFPDEDYLVRLVRLRDGKPAGPGLEGAPQVSDVHEHLFFSPDGSRLFVRGHDARVYDTATGRLLWRHNAPSKGIGTVWWSRDGSAAFFQTGEGYVIYSAGPGPPPEKPAPLGPIMAVSPDRTVALVLVDGPRLQAARLRDGRPTGEPVGFDLRRDANPSHIDPETVKFHPDGASYVVGDDEGRLLWADTASGRVLGRNCYAGGAVGSLALDPEGRRLLVCGRSSAALFEMLDPDRADPLALPNEGGVATFALHPGGRLLLTGTHTGEARVWDLQTGRPVGASIRVGRPVRSSAFSPDGRREILGGGDQNLTGLAQIREVDGGAPIGPDAGHTSDVRGVAFSPDGTTALSWGMDHTVRFTDAATGRPVGPPVVTAGGAFSAAFSPDGSTVLVGEEGSQGTLLDARTHAVLKRLPVRTGHVGVVAYAPDGRTCATGSWAGYVQLWRLPDGVPIEPPLEHGGGTAGRITAIAFSPDSRLVATAAMDRKVQLWDASTGASVGPPMVHPAAVGSLDFSPDGRTLATGSNQARLWDVATGKPVGPPLGRSGRAVPSRFSLDGRRLIIADGAILRVIALTVPWVEAPEAAAEHARRLTQPGIQSESGPPAVAPAPRPTPATTPRPIAIAWHEAAANQALAESAWGSALWRLDRLAALEPGDPWCRVRRAKALARLGRADDAQADVREALRNPERADVPGWVEDLAMSAATAKDWPAVFLLADELIAARPGWPGSYALRCEAQSALGRHDQAAADAARFAVLADPASPALLTLSDGQMRRGNLPVAAMLLERAGSGSDMPDRARHALALCRLERGDFSGYRDLTRPIPGLLAAPRGLSVARANTLLWTLAVGPDAVVDWSPAIGLGERVVSALPPEQRRDVMNTLGAVLCRAGRDEEAIRVLEEGIRLSKAPALFDDLVFLAISLHRLGREDEARSRIAETKASRDPVPDDPWSRLEREILQREAEAVVPR